MPQRLQISILIQKPADARALEEDLMEFLAQHDLSEQILESVATVHPHVPYGASDPGPAFDRTAAARTSGVTVDVTEPGGVMGLGGTHSG